jgi:hypothetical protein
LELALLNERLSGYPNIGDSSVEFFYGPSLASSHRQEASMKKSEEFLKNAENCARLAESAANAPTRNRFERMATAWRALAEEQDWLDGEVPPVRTNGEARKTPSM